MLELIFRCTQLSRDCIPCFHFAINVNDIESKFTRKGANDIDIDVLKIFLLLNADDIVIFAESADDLQNSLDILCDYCQNCFTTGGSLNTAQSTLSGQAQKAIFSLNKYLTKFSYLIPSHV